MPPEMMHSSAAEADAETSRRLGFATRSSMSVRGGGWRGSVGGGSLLEREMERERQKQREWEESQKAKAGTSPVRSDREGAGVGGSSSSSHSNGVSSPKSTSSTSLASTTSAADNGRSSGARAVSPFRSSIGMRSSYSSNMTGPGGASPVPRATPSSPPMQAANPASAGTSMSSTSQSRPQTPTTVPHNNPYTRPGSTSPSKSGFGTPGRRQILGPRPRPDRTD